MQNYKKPLKGPSKSSSSGQVLPIGIGLLAVAIITIFLVLNSGRAVNEKINLVNAADAAAYSGAQVAARHLNYMAYTNRAMIANEVAIGHMFSFQAEIDVLQDWVNKGLFSSAFSGGIGGLFFGIVSLIPGAQELILGILNGVADTSKVVSSMLNLMYNANNAKFTNYQQLAYIDLISQDPGTGVSVVGATMQAVANTYAARPNAPIRVNQLATIDAFSNDPESGVQAAAQTAGNYDQALCQMIMFAQPSAAGTMSTVDMAQACNGIVNGGGANLAIADEDGAQMMEIIRNTYTTLDSGNWIQDRNTDYTTLGSSVSRRGETQLDFQNGHITWTAEQDTISLWGSTGTASGDVNSFVDNARSVVDRVGFAALRDLGACDSSGQTADGDACGGLYNKEYRSIERYAVLNPEVSSVLVTAFLDQGNCSDSIGYDKSGNELSGWTNNLKRFEDVNSTCDDTVYALSQAEVFYQRPDCYSGEGECGTDEVGFSSLDGGVRESANLFNPFWQVRLVPTQEDN